MFISTKKFLMPTPKEALPGRSEEIQIGNRQWQPLKPPSQTRRWRSTRLGQHRKFWQVDGVYSTAVGYSAGRTPNPTYQEVCSGLTGHVEVVRVVFDPQITSYAELLRVFWENHDPTQGMRQGNDLGTQYRSGIFF